MAESEDVGGAAAAAAAAAADPVACGGDLREERPYRFYHTVSDVVVHLATPS
jgi:hypothetical protein